MKRLRGFTVIELLGVIALLGVLLAIAFPSFQTTYYRMKVRTTTNLITQTINMAKTESLRRNIKIYFAPINESMCIGTSLGGCDLRQEAFISGVSVSGSAIVFSPFYGIPSPAPTTFTVSYSGVSQKVTINRLGIVTVGELSS